MTDKFGICPSFHILGVICHSPYLSVSLLGAIGAFARTYRLVCLGLSVRLPVPIG